MNEQVPSKDLSMALLREWHLADERFDLEDWSRRVRNFVEDAPQFFTDTEGAIDFQPVATPEPQPAASKELAYRDALARIRQVCRSDAKDFEAATIERHQVYDIANMTLDAHGDLYASGHEPAAAASNDLLDDAQGLICGIVGWLNMQAIENPNVLALHAGLRQWLVTYADRAANEPPAARIDTSPFGECVYVTNNGCTTCTEPAEPGSMFCTAHRPAQPPPPTLPEDEQAARNVIFHEWNYQKNRSEDYPRWLEAQVLKLRRAAQPPSEYPEELFDGCAVERELTGQARRRTSTENVIDVLDAVVRLMKRRRARQTKGAGL